MPDVSIAVSARNNYSRELERMSSDTATFNKEVEMLNREVSELNKKKASLRTDLDGANKEIREARKGLDGTAESVKRLEEAHLRADGIRDGLQDVSQAAKDAKKDLAGANEELKKPPSPGGLLSQIGKAGAYKMIGDAAGEIAGVLVSSAYGSQGGTMFSSVLGGAASGAAIGSMIAPGVGTAIGAGVGGLVGAASGATQIFSQRDDAFKGYVQEQTEGQLAAQGETLGAGSTVAGSREQTFMAFEHRFGSADAAEDYLERVRQMAIDTNYDYDEIVGYSKSLLNSYDPDGVFDVLTSLSDASAGLNLSSDGVNMFIAGLSRMRTTGKASTEYLNFFSERGLDVYEALSQSTGTSKANVTEMLSKGEISGDNAAQSILDYINNTFGGLSDKLSTTYDALVDNLGDIETDMQAAMGDAYNEARKGGIQAQMNWLEGDSGDAITKANEAVGAWKAELENSKEEYIRDAVDAMMSSEEYKSAEAEGDAAEMGKLIMQAKVQGMNEYNASEGAQLAAESEVALADSIRNDAASNSAYWDAGFRKGEEYNKGLAAGMVSAAIVPSTPPVKSGRFTTSYGTDYDDPHVRAGASRAFGLNRVPYDDYAVRLHAGERVLTAGQARQMDASGGLGGGIVINMSVDTIRETADIRSVASELVSELTIAMAARKS